MEKRPDKPTPEMLEQIVESLAGRIQDLDEELQSLRSRSTVDLAAAILAHEVCNILTPSKALAQMALKKPEDAEFTKRSLERIITGIDRTTEIAETVIEMTEGVPEGTSHRTNVLDAAREAVDSLARDLTDSPVTVEMRIPPALLADISRVSLVQVLVNLVTNATRAIEAAGKGEGRIRIEAERTSCSTWNTGAIRLAVIDDGPGIDPSLRERLFEPFVRTPDSRKQGGRGLGLSICRQLIQAVGGSLEVSSSMGHGACFSMILPASVAETTQAA